MDPIVFTLKVGLDFRFPRRKPDQVFIVHGHDHALKNELCALLSRMHLEPVVLQRQVDKGHTIIEKFEKNSKVRYAIVLLTPDDVAFPKIELEKPEAERNITFRARQNVIFELGFFIGRLGRANVCCICRRGIEIPSDLLGLTYKEVDTSVDHIGLGIVTELREAGLNLKI
jgi:predicted nucleotide-binding protein